MVDPRRRGLPHAVPDSETPKWARGPPSLPGCHHAAPSYCHKKTPRKGFLRPAPEQGLSIVGSGGRIRTCDLRVMSPTSCQTAPPRTGNAHDTKTGVDVSSRNAGHRRFPPTPRIRAGCRDFAAFSAVRASGPDDSMGVSGFGGDCWRVTSSARRRALRDLPGDRRHGGPPARRGAASPRARARRSGQAPARCPIRSR